MRRRVLIAGQLACLFIVIAAVVFYHDVLLQSIGAYTSRAFRPLPHSESSASSVTPTPAAPTTAAPEDPVAHDSLDDGASSPAPASASSSASSSSSTPTPTTPAPGDAATHKKLNNTAAYVAAVMNASDTTFPRLECPRPDLGRYERLKANGTDAGDILYFFALDLRECVSLLPRLLGSVVEAMRFLGPQHCALSIVEGNSEDGTPEVLEAVRGDIEALGALYRYQPSDINPGQGDRIAKLATLRNMALRPMVDEYAPGGSSRYGANTTVVFLNDVAICMEDILELVLQRAQLGADMTCAMDWTYVGHDPTFYDIWIARTLAGDSFFEIPPGGSWNSAWNLFWNDADTRARYSAHRPFQVFSCWNGATAIGAAPLLEREVAFRGGNPGECFQGEPSLFCKDMWRAGHGKIAVVPGISLEYSDERGRDIKSLKGWTSQWASAEPETIEWKLTPPDMVKCIPDYDNQHWRPWNETLDEVLR